MTEIGKKAVMDHFLQEADPLFLGRSERGLLFEVCGNGFYSVRLTLTGAEDDPPENAVWDHAGLRPDGEDGYILCARWEEEPDTKTQEADAPVRVPFELPFRDYEICVEYFDGTAAAFGYAPWDRLADCCRELAEKADCPFTELNERERELLPLIRELAALGDRESAPEKDCPLLEKMATDRGCEALIPRMKHMMELERRCEPADKTRERELEAAVREVNSADSEPLWRAILDRLKESQDGFPKERLLITDPARYARYREETARITDYFLDNGYTGSFPAFEKEGHPAKRRTRTSYGQRFRLTPEDEKRFFVRFRPSYRLEARDVLVSTDITAGFIPGGGGKQAERPSGLFFDGGKSLAETFFMDIPLEDLPDRRGRNRRVPGELSSGQLSRLRGWLEGEKRLSEHQMVRPVTAAVMIFMLLLAGLAGFVLVGLLMLLAGSLVLLIAGKGAEIPGMIRDIPWGKLLLFSEAVCLLFPVLRSLIRRIRERKTN